MILEKFECGTDEEKTYAARYFAFIKDSLAYTCLLSNSYSDYEYLAQNCASTLAAWQDKESFNQAIEKLSDEDDFEKLEAVKFLSSYGSKEAIPAIINAMKNSAMAENIAGEIPYIMNLFELLDNNFEDALLVINHIINGLGEILPLSIIFDFELYDVFEKLINNQNNSKCSVVLLNAAEKFETLTENDEYLFDEDKDTKNEIHDIKKILERLDKKELEKNINNELNENSLFVYTALDFTKEPEIVKDLLKSNNQTLILKSAEILKKLGCFDDTTRTVALLKVTDLNIKNIIRAL